MSKSLILMLIVDFDCFPGYSIWHSAPPLCLRWCPDDRSGCTGCGAGGQGDQHGQPQIVLKHWSTAALYVVIVNIAKLSPNLSQTNLDQVRPNPIFHSSIHH